MVKKKKESFFQKKFVVKKVIKPAPALTSTQKRELVRRIVAKTEIEPIRVEPSIEPAGEIFEEPISKLPPFKIRSDILKQENGSILTRNRNIFFKE